MSRRLDALFRASAEAHPDALAVRDPVRDQQVTYRELDELSRVFADALPRAGVVAGDRIGICAPKSIASVAAVLGSLRAGCAYVPVDYTAPAARNAYIFDDCAVAAIVADPEVADGLQSESGCSFLRADMTLPVATGVDVALLISESARESTQSVPDDLAYILYTSGSTGKPKGVMHTHRSALAFVDWCSERFRPRADDRFSSHASFHFDLSIHDLYVPLKHGAAIVLIGESAGKQPSALARLIATECISVWYSTPSILRLLVDLGDMSTEDYLQLRIVHFAGEVFPVKHLRALKQIWPHPEYFNLYGPTETNVCTYFPIPEVVPEDRTAAYPIGYPCCDDECRVVHLTGEDVASGDEGELVVTGGSVMVGYWNLPERNAAAFLVDAVGTRWYRTGDVVRDSGGQCFEYLGRRDRMVKRRGYRVELGEIEAALYRHPQVTEAAVVAIPDEQAGVRIEAFVCWTGEGRPSLIRMKQYCAQSLPLYMVPDRFVFPPELPKTSTDKIDYQRLQELSL